MVNNIVQRLGSFTSRNFAAIEKEDLIQCGLIGLMEAAKNYDDNRGVLFATYAARRIKGAIQDELRRLDFVPRSVRRSEREGKALTAKIEQTTGGNIDFTDAAAILGISEDELKEKIHSTSAEGSLFVSLDEITGDDMTEIADDELTPEEEIEKNELKEKLAAAIQQLPDQQRMVILLYYYEELTLREIGAILHITESRVAQIHKAVLELMRAAVRSVHGRTITAGVQL